MDSKAATADNKAVTMDNKVAMEDNRVDTEVEDKEATADHLKAVMARALAVLQAHHHKFHHHGLPNG